VTERYTTPSLRDKPALSPRKWAIVELGMKKKPINEPIIAPQILAMAKKSVDADRPPPPPKPCAVCGSSCTPLTGPITSTDEENLCWVCRRLKISAWRDSDHQMSAQE